jgi:hypothetical protein
LLDSATTADTSGAAGHHVGAGRACGGQRVKLRSEQERSSTLTRDARQEHADPGARCTTRLPDTDGLG